MQWKQTLWLYIIVINIVAFTIMGLDKSKSRRGKWRISERTLFNMAFIGGSLGILAGMYIFRHKTGRNKFRWGIPLIIVVQTVLSPWILSYLS